MKDRLIDFLRSSYAMALGVICLITILFLLIREKPENPPEKQSPSKLPLVKGGNDSLKESPLIEVSKHFTPWRSIAGPTKKPEAPVAPQPALSAPLPKLIHDFELVQKMPAKEQPKAATPPAPTFPFGSVIVCRLLQSVQCGRESVPVIAELLQPVKDAKGQEWIPRGTRIHGSVKSGSLPGRIESAGDWIFILPGQKLLEIKANLQDRDFDPGKRLYGINDGTAGIFGTEIRAKKSEWKQTALKDGVAIATEASMDRMNTALGQVELGTARNAVLRGVSSLVGGIVPKEIPIETESYVSVPAGKEFYLYVNEQGATQPVARTNEIGTMLRERAQLMEQLRQQIGRGTP